MVADAGATRPPRDGDDESLIFQYSAAGRGAAGAVRYEASGIVKGGDQYVLSLR